MGKIFKLTPEIKEWIINKKRTHPSLSCRALGQTSEKEFKVKISKSSINALFKEAGLSMPIGRRIKNTQKTGLLPTGSSEALIKAVTPLLGAPAFIEKALLTQAEAPKISSPEQNLVTPPTQIKEAIENKEDEKPIALPMPEAPLQPTAVPEPIVIIQQPLQPVIPTPQISSRLQEKLASSGIILLKAMDYLINGTATINELISKHIGVIDNSLIETIESLVYAPALETPEEELIPLLDRIQPADRIAENIRLRVLDALTQVRCVRILLNNNEDLYLDGTLHTTWSVPNVPYEFGNTLSNVKKHINRYFYKEKALVLFTAPGYDSPTNEFMNLSLGLLNHEKYIERIVFCNDKLNEVESMRLEENKERHIIFAVWPWQFTSYRRIKKVGEYKPYFSGTHNKDVYLADIEVELRSSQNDLSFSFKGYAVKTTPTEKARLIILTNMPQEIITPDHLLNLYLNHWPNFEEAFQDFSRKVELFTYTAESQDFLNPDNILIPSSLGIRQLLNQYLQALDLYFKWHFLPSGYENQSLKTTQADFYSVQVKSSLDKGCLSITLETPQNSAVLKALEYACLRLNEREITDRDGNRMVFKISLIQ